LVALFCLSLFVRVWVLTVKALVALFCLSLFVRVWVLTVKALVALFCLSLFVRVWVNCQSFGCQQNRATKSLTVNPNSNKQRKTKQSNQSFDS
jgi:hypothetical protein